MATDCCANVLIGARLVVQHVAQELVRKHVRQTGMTSAGEQKLKTKRHRYIKVSTSAHACLQCMYSQQEAMTTKYRLVNHLNCAEV